MPVEEIRIPGWAGPQFMVTREGKASQFMVAQASRLCSEQSISPPPARRRCHDLGVLELPCIFLTVMEDRTFVSDFLRKGGHHPVWSLEDGVEAHYTRMFSTILSC